MKALKTWVLWAGLIVAACGGASSSGSSNSETHFLGLCSGDDCGDGLSCICGVCTVTCDPAASCGALNANAICASSSSSSCGDDTAPSVCDVDCDRDGDCASLGAGFECQAGVCRQPGCVAEGRVYEEGATFEVDCNTCTCGSDGEVACTRAACVDTCEYDGNTYDIGEEFSATDGCNTCTCSVDGVLCTEIGCGGNTCEYDGNTYDIGEEFPSYDGCNTCGCTADGVVCTDAACVDGCTIDGIHYDLGENFLADDGCNTCSCGEDGVTCTAVGCHGVRCVYDNTIYDIGEEFPAADGCNTCACTADGVACTDAACAGCQVGDRFYEYGDRFLADDGCNTCSCEEDGAGCSQGDCSKPECMMPFEAGECLAFVPVFYYDAQAARCLEQTYGGCGGNDNRFETLEACQQRCQEFDNGD
ncbi:MAG TPA: BPTI/Kunitz-type proteinase inhibitor domain-containing protein [Polyangiaceae bacterium]